MSSKGAVIGILFAISLPIMITLITELPDEFTFIQTNLLMLIPIFLLGIIAYLIWQ